MMDVQLDQVAVRDNPQEERYEAEAGGHMAVVEYEREGNRITFLHTEVPPELEGHGLAAKMARTALEDAQAQGLEVVPVCPYVASYIRRHQGYLPLVAPEQRAEVTVAHSG